MHWLEGDLPQNRTDLVRPDRHQADRQVGRHLCRLVRCVRPGEQPHNPTLAIGITPECGFPHERAARRSTGQHLTDPTPNPPAGPGAGL
jgi:hypothetical protein